MQTQNKILILIAIFFVTFLSCNKSVTGAMEEALEMSLKGKISFLERKEQWDGFKGDGYYVEVYDVKDKYLDELIASFQKKNFSFFDENNRGDDLNYPGVLDYPDISEYTQGEGYYKYSVVNNEIELLAINIKTKKIISYQVFF